MNCELSGVGSRNPTLRYDMRRQASFTMDQGIVVGEGLVRDCSPGGYRIRSFTLPPPGSTVELCMYPDDRSGGLVIQSSTACWARDHEFGVAFVIIDPKVTHQLASPRSALVPSGSRVQTS
jgi:hypothetical protein